MKLTMRELGKHVSFLGEKNIFKKGIVAAIYTVDQKCMILVTDKKDAALNSESEILSLPMEIVDFSCITSVIN